MMSAPSRLYVTPYYRDPRQNEIDQAPLEVGAALAYDFAKADMGNASKILLDWAQNCREVVNAEARWGMTTWGNLFNEAYLLLDSTAWNSGVYRVWVKYVLRPCADRNYHRLNNRGSWAILSCAQADIILGADLERHRGKLYDHMRQSSNQDGVLIHEITRTRSGPWYCYYTLAPMLRACQLLDVDPTPLYKPLEWYWGFCLDPHSWPYMEPPKPFNWWGLSWIWQWAYASDKELQIPTPTDWPGNLYREAGKVFGRKDWVDYGQGPFYTSIYRG